jgi:hypothetical protein
LCPLAEELRVTNKPIPKVPDVIAVNFTLDREAYELLRQRAPTTKAFGRHICRLLYEERARAEERQRLGLREPALAMSEAGEEAGPQPT